MQAFLGPEIFKRAATLARSHKHVAQSALRLVDSHDSCQEAVRRDGMCETWDDCG